MAFLNRTEELRTRFLDKKAEIANDIRMNQQASRITNFFRRYAPLPKKWRTRRFARFYGAIIRRDFDTLTNKKEKHALAKYVNEGIIKRKAINILNWYNWNVQQIYWAWDRYKRLNSDRRNKLEGMWNMILERMMVKDTRGKKAKRKKKGRLDIGKYLNIPTSTRDDYLREHYNK